jgi:hypothetical protein
MYSFSSDKIFIKNAIFSNNQLINSIRGVNFRTNLNDFKRLIFILIKLDKNKLKDLINWSFSKYGEKKTVDLAERLKSIGYSYATWHFIKY